MQVLTGLAPVFQFVHGLAFFILGMAISFSAPRSGRLELGRRLPLLAILAFCEAGVAWNGVLALALRTASLIPPLLQTSLLILGYGAFLAFGLLLPLPPGRRSRLRSSILPAILSLWLVVLLLSVVADIPGPPVAFWGEIIARYGLALPGSIPALLSMRSQTYYSIDPHVLGRIKGARRITGVALGVLGFLAGFVYPSGLLLSRLQTAGGTVEILLLIVSLLLSLCGFAAAYGLVRMLNVVQWEVERWIEGVEHSMALAADRERIGRELHDGIIQSIYAAGLMLEGVRQLIHEDPAGAERQLGRAMVSLNQTIQDIRRYIFDLRGGAGPDTDLVTGLEELLRDFRVNTLLETELIVTGEDAHPLGVERRRHIFQIAREALSNVARHAQARRVVVRLSYEPERLQLQIADDGVGLAVIPTAHGQGLHNVRERARLLEGTLDIESAPGQGVTLTLTVPYT